MNINAIYNERFRLQHEFSVSDTLIFTQDPLVSVCVTTYQHAKFIRECLEGILMQQTNFPFEVVIGEDGSSDGTREICIEFASKYPKLIRLFLRERNLSQLYDENETFLAMFNGTWTVRSAKGKYVALCEGDDYWIDPLKLQKQVDFLEANQDFSICHHNAKVIYEDNSCEPYFSDSPNQQEITTISDLARDNYIINASCVFRNGLIDEIPEWYLKSPVKDYILHMFNARFGKIRYFHEPMCVYRIHKGGVWSTENVVYKSEILAKLLEPMKHYFSSEINSILAEAQFQYYFQLYQHDLSHNEKHGYYYDKVIASDPNFILNLLDVHLKNQKEYERKIKSIYNSWSYKIGNFIISPVYLISKLFRY